MLHPFASDIKTLSPLTLAFIGDGVYEMYIREKLVSKGNAPMSKINPEKQRLASAKFQSSLIEKLLPSLTEQEISVFKRGRNAKVSNIPKNGDHESYHNATGFEALIGYLYLSDEHERMLELLKIV